MADYRNILVETHGSIEVLTLNRPDVLNAVSPEMATELTDYFGGLHERLDVRAVVLRAAGRAFCAGLDIKAWPLPEGATMVVHMARTQKMMGDIMRKMRSCPQPIVALGQGAACGAGFSMMLASDVRFGAPSLRMNAAYIKIGLGGCDIGSSYFLPRLVGVSIASELILTGRFINAERALRVGLLSDVVDEDRLLETGLELAEEMVANSPIGLRMSKEALNFNVDAQSLDAAMALEDRQQIMLTATQDHIEAMQAFVEKRPPVYTGN
ncbi:enoyl-CoA hydratase/isomerase family protein (plasmid) [Sphingomonas paeninsulae]|jgi:enoyl-CoA hydratase/carnithine racemase|uniref:Enoyl-CoA hydratase/isomerase family protein n=1 Tax=Sphingomonas paeninsulae TaxID=2319844 RepID=A0A494T8L2_SPHPE|nr:enoyl-CoA hydratase-related protein [Sphingomonas paeninsulae]AYJ85270.1 enoyl-CoA hydratase/isomerase family protein [Sphingomonas paeninsulae]